MKRKYAEFIVWAIATIFLLLALLPLLLNLYHEMTMESTWATVKQVEKIPMPKYGSIQIALVDYQLNSGGQFVGQALNSVNYTVYEGQELKIFYHPLHPTDIIGEYKMDFSGKALFFFSLVLYGFGIRVYLKARENRKKYAFLYEDSEEEKVTRRVLHS